jgi:hypothetical protein
LLFSFFTVTSEIRKPPLPKSSAKSGADSKVGHQSKNHVVNWKPMDPLAPPEQQQATAVQVYPSGSSQSSTSGSSQSSPSGSSQSSSKSSSSKGRPSKLASRQGDHLRTHPKSQRGVHLNNSPRDTSGRVQSA